MNWRQHIVVREMVLAFLVWRKVRLGWERCTTTATASAKASASGVSGTSGSVGRDKRCGVSEAMNHLSKAGFIDSGWRRGWAGRSGPFSSTFIIKILRRYEGGKLHATDRLLRVMKVDDVRDWIRVAGREWVGWESGDDAFDEFDLGAKLGER